MSTWTTQDIPPQQGRKVVITGATGGLGYETALALAKAGADVLMTGRNEAKGKDALARVKATVPGAKVRYAHLDLADLASVEAFAGQLAGEWEAIDLLVNNAGVMTPPTRHETADGFELQFGTNYLGHFALTGLLLKNLISVDGSRIVVVSSNAHKLGGEIHFDDLQWERRYNRGAAYAQSKLANLMFCYELQRRLAAADVPTIAVAAHPGYTDSELIRHVWKPVVPLMRLFGPVVGQDPAKGALPQLLAATDPQVRGGQYWGPRGLFELKGYPKLVTASAKARDEAVQKRLWTVAEELTGVTFPV
jgi:NAD(P)-dependent dehydrogenase (short-subunit alcohol dehydrogenase family)